MKEKLAIVGAGSAMFTRGLLADMLRRRWEAELALVDPDPEALRVAEGLARKMVDAVGAPVEVSASTDRRDVLAGATAVVSTVGVGGRPAWMKDVTIPRKYGIYQPVGDTVMPGGTSRALRMVPAMVAVGEDVLDLAPEALFFNYGNPMAAVCRGIRKATGAPVTGLCIGVHEVAEYLARALGAELEDLGYTAVGMNHLTWFTEVRVRGADAMPRLREVARARTSGAPPSLGTGPAPGGEAPGLDNPFSWRLLETFGAFPAVLDRHVTEFFPQFFADGEYYGRKLGVDAFSFEQCLAGGDRIHQEMREAGLSDKPLAPEYLERSGGEHQKVLEIIESIRTDAGKVYSANLPNAGRVAGLPDEAILEGPAMATAAGLRPLAVPPLAPGIAGTLATRLQWVETVVDAALEGSREKFVQALVLDGAARSLDTASALADELLAAHAEHLPQFAAAGG